ncbi:hypothetical protein QE450_002388 [Paenibacillus sp. SORGH_AS306]|uniref:hypothetical protein n=1 Tax=unclassified Paenibacillus TaxID=185978 RepID=UPI002789C2B0|nr:MULTISPECIES: hypothetical protein [unclassified Paenibacillus]MDQ1234890.1 hypothetical protein [Paenibacillus sp. SORGH_AS_0306]MDR6111938.1 hypothetical protein [Paenibacillus sp. SORGH_AS_0338]
MLKITQKFINELYSKQDINYEKFQGYIGTIIRYGDQQDAEALYSVFIQDPLAYEKTQLIEPIMRLGDNYLAQTLYEFSIVDNDLTEEVPYEVLHALGYMGLEQVAPVLIKYVLESELWDTCTVACLGLVHLSIEKYQQELKNRLEQSINKSLFNEFLPIFSFRLYDDTFVERLYEWGDKHASIDCNAGLILGIALYGKEQKETIKNIIWSSNWQAHDMGTGTGKWTYQAMGYVGLTFEELIDDMKRFLVEITSNRELEYRLDVLHFLLTFNLTYFSKDIKFTNTDHDNIELLYKLLYSSNNEGTDESILECLKKRFDQDEQFSIIESYERLEIQMSMQIRFEVEREQLLF